MRDRRWGLVAGVLAVALALAACAPFTFGREFPSPRPGAEIRNGATTKADLLKTFGEPTQVGIKDGDRTWTWYYAKKSSDRELSKTLEVTFGAGDIVRSYSFSSSFPDDMKAR